MGRAMKRFWKTVSVLPYDEGFGISLDAKEMKTPLKASLIVPTRAYAEGIAAEWAAVEGEIKPLTMHLTRAANATIDSVIEKRAEVANMLAEYANTDLICYRADTPAELVARQATAWDPMLAWAASIGAPLTTITGIIFAPQPEESIQTLSAMVHEYDAWQLTALHDLIAISGSLVLGLAVAKRHLTAEAAWPLSRIDESWQIEQWGVDDEAEEKAARKERDFLRAAHLLSLLEEH